MVDLPFLEFYPGLALTAWRGTVTFPSLVLTINHAKCLRQQCNPWWFFAIFFCLVCCVTCDTVRPLRWVPCRHGKLLCSFIGVSVDLFSGGWHFSFVKFRNFGWVKYLLFCKPSLTTWVRVYLSTCTITCNKRHTSNNPWGEIPHLALMQHPQQPTLSHIQYALVIKLNIHFFKQIMYL